MRDNFYFTNMKKTITYLKKAIVCTFLFLASILIHSQPKNIQLKIDKALFEDYSKLLDEGNYNFAIILTQKIIKQSKEYDYHQGVIKGYCNLSYIMCKLGKYKESFIFLKFAEKENEKENDKGMQSYIAAHKGYTYNCINLFNQGISNIKRSLSLSENLAQPKLRHEIKSFCYSNLTFSYENLNKKDSVNYYRKLAFKDLPDMHNSSNLANYYIYTKNDLDSASYYLKFASDRSTSVKPLASELAFFYKTYGEYYEEKKQYDSSKIFYLKALEICKERKWDDYLVNCYAYLHNISELQNDTQAAHFYLLKYTNLSDSLSKNQKLQTNFPIQQYIQENQEAYDKKENEYQFLLIGACTAFVLFSIFSLLKYQKKERKLRERIKVKKGKLIEKENETQELKSRVKDGFDEVILLAKKNNPEFVTRFIEVYPDFYQALLRIYPDINTENLKFCALLRLNFSTKDIAEYNFITPRAIQLRKNRLRKKLNISSTEDIYTWFNNLDKNGSV